MALGYEVTKPILDLKMAQAALDLRNAFEKSSIVAKYLADHPVVSGTDPLIALFGYTTDESANLRVVFEGFASAYTNLAYNFGVASQITGLE